MLGVTWPTPTCANIASNFSLSLVSLSRSSSTTNTYCCISRFKEFSLSLSAASLSACALIIFFSSVNKVKKCQKKKVLQFFSLNERHFCLFSYLRVLPTGREISWIVRKALASFVAPFKQKGIHNFTILVLATIIRIPSVSHCQVASAALLFSPRCHSLLSDVVLLFQRVFVCMSPFRLLSTVGTVGTTQRHESKLIHTNELLSPSH